MTDDPGPHEALAAVRDSRAALGARIRPVLAEEIALAVATGGVLAAFALPPPWGSLAMVPFVLAMSWLMVLARNRTGLMVNRAVCARARWIGLAVGLAIAGLALVVILSSLLLDLRWPALACGLLAAVITFFGRRAWLRAIMDDLAGLPR